MTPLEEWISNKDFSNDEVLTGPTWHIPSAEEIQFANELLNLHLESALEELLKLCQDNIHSDPGSEKDHLKVTLLRIDSSLRGVMSCLPDFIPSFKTGKVEDPPFLIAGATGPIVGRTGLREKAADVIHVASKYLLEKNSDDSILLLLLIRIIEALGNYGNGEFEEWNNHRQAWKVESVAIKEPPVNFIVPCNSKGNKRPRWALIDKSYMHNTWRTSKSSYNLYRTSKNASPSENLDVLVNDLLNLCVHSYDTVRKLAGKSLAKLIKRWPCLIEKCVLTLTENLRSPSSSEYTVLGSCAVLGTQTVLKHLNLEPKSLSSFLLAILLSSQHESLKSQKAIIELFFKYNVYFEGVSRNIFKKLEDHSGTDFAALLSEIGSVNFESSNLHWRYNLMANRVLLLFAMSSRDEPNSSSKILNEAAGHFLTNLKSQLPQARILAISALNMLLKESPYKVSSVNLQENTKSSLEGTLSNIFQEERFFTDTFESLSNVHIISDTENSSSRGNNGNSSFRSIVDKSITRFYFNFSSAWPRTPTWISSFATDTFYPSFARIFKRLVQECGVVVLLSLKTALNEFVNAKERSKQCVAAEAFAGLLHADIIGLVEEWDNWMMAQLENIILAPSVDSVPEWAACIRYAVTGKGKYGTKIPLLRQRILDCLVKPLPHTVTTTVVTKRYLFFSAALIEISPARMPLSEIQIHYKLLQELMDNMSHPTAHVREVIAVALSVLCSNIRLHSSVNKDYSFENGKHTNIGKYAGSWDQILLKKASELVVAIQNANPSDSLDNFAEANTLSGSDSNSPDDVQWMETLFYFVISLMKSGRSAFLLDVLVGVLYPVISLQETSNKDLSILAKAAFGLLKWRIFTNDHLRKAVSILLSLAEDPNWRTRSATLTFLRSFMYRHMFVLSDDEKQKIWKAVEKLLTDNQVEASFLNKER